MRARNTPNRNTKPGFAGALRKMTMKTPANVLKQGTDYAAGWETGRNKGRERLSGKRLVDRLPPEHIRMTARAGEWMRGYADGLRDRSCASRSMVCYYDNNGRFVVEHKTGARSAIVNALALKGIAGDVEITRNGRTHRCGI